MKVKRLVMIRNRGDMLVVCGEFHGRMTRICRYADNTVV